MENPHATQKKLTSVGVNEDIPQRLSLIDPQADERLHGDPDKHSYGDTVHCCNSCGWKRRRVFQLEVRVVIRLSV